MNAAHLHVVTPQPTRKSFSIMILTSRRAYNTALAHKLLSSRLESTGHHELFSGRDGELPRLRLEELALLVLRHLSLCPSPIVARLKLTRRVDLS
jgi:hypothetical protein